MLHITHGKVICILTCGDAMTSMLSHKERYHDVLKDILMHPRQRETSTLIIFRQRSLP